MARIRQEARDYELRRWMRLDWRRWWKPGCESDPLYKEFERVERKYRPDQLRLPRGSEGGGQWTDEGAPASAGGGDRVISSILSRARQLAAGGRTTYLRCLELCSPLLERFQQPGSDRNQWDFHKCMNVCLGR